MIFRRKRGQWDQVGVNYGVKEFWSERSREVEYPERERKLQDSYESVKISSWEVERNYPCFCCLSVAILLCLGAERDGNTSWGCVCRWDRVFFGLDFRLSLEYFCCFSVVICPCLGAEPDGISTWGWVRRWEVLFPRQEKPSLSMVIWQSSKSGGDGISTWGFVCRWDVEFSWRKNSSISVVAGWVSMAGVDGISAEDRCYHWDMMICHEDLEKFHRSNRVSPWW